jgi:hypothetical protein
LLGELPSEKQEQVEELLLTREDFFEELLIIEDELVDDYLRDKLSADEQKNFRHYFLSTPERYEKLRVARAFKRYLDEKVAAEATVTELKPALKPASWWRALQGYLSFPQMRLLAPAMIILLIAIALGALWILKNKQPVQIAREESSPPQLSPSTASIPPNRNIPEAKETGHTPAETGRTPTQVAEGVAPNRNAAPEQRPERALRNPPARTPTLAVTLIPGMLRSAGSMQEVNLSRGEERLQLKLSLTSDDYRQYRAVLQTAGGRNILSRDNLKRSGTPQGPTVIVTVPTTLLSPGEYRLTLSGATPDKTFETAGQYYFKVNKN